MNVLEQLIKYILEWSNSVKHMNKLLYSDKARYSEKFYAEVFSTTYFLSLNNLNIIKSNFEAIDLGDLDHKVCFQITSTYSKDKIENTIKLFFENNLNEKFKILKIFFMCDEKDRSGLNRVIDDTKIEVMSLNNLFKDFEALLPSKQRRILNLLKSEFDDNPEIRERSFWVARMRHQYPINLTLESGDNTELVNTFFNSRLVLNSFNHDFRMLLNNLLREILQNVKKHGTPYLDAIQISIERQRICITDWGNPFSPRKLAYLEDDPRCKNGTHLYKELKRRLRRKFKCKYIPGEYGKAPNITKFHFFEPLEILNLYEDCCIWLNEVGRSDLYKGCQTVYYLPERRHNGSQSRDEYEYFVKSLKGPQKTGIALFEDDTDKLSLLKRNFPEAEFKIVKKIHKKP